MHARSIHTVLRFCVLFFTAAIAVAASRAAFAQNAPPLSMMVPGWRPPVLQVAGAEQPVRLAALKVDVEVAGGAAETRVRMVFLNPNSRTLEGKLQFPLAPGQVVSGFALDVDGRMREAVPVAKARAEQVFEDISRRRVDPGVLQTTLGNNYELRIYPLLPGRTRTVELTIVEPAGARLAVPLAYAERVGSVEVAVRYPAATAAPEIVGTPALGLRFERQPRGGYLAQASASDALLPREPLVVKAPAAPAGDVAVTTAELDGQHYFTVEVGVPTRTAPRPLPRSVQIVWDASGSGASRHLDRELALLDAYFARARDSAVNLVRVADTVAPAERFEIRGGDWSALRRALEETRYDGASNLGAVRHDGTSAEAIWFSDGLATYGEPWRLAFPVPVYAVNSAASSDPAALQALADRTGGRGIDLAALTRQAAADALLRRGTQLADIAALGARDIAVQSGSAASGRLVVAGLLTADVAELALRLRDSSGAVTVRRVRVAAGEHRTRLAALQWARLTLASLEGDARTNKVRIAEIGKRFRVATRETSLLVLEQIDDYVRHEIEPPAELRAAFDKIAQTTVRRRAESDAARLERVVRRFEARIAWWNHDFPKDSPPAPLQVAKTAPEASLGGTLSAPRENTRRERSGALAADEARSIAKNMAPAPATALPSSGFAAQKAESSLARRKDGAAETEQTSIAIALTPASASSAAIKRLQAARADEWTVIYLDERRANATSVGFFLDAAEFFIAKGDGESRARGLRALSNLAEMDLQNRQVLRLLAYRLQQAGETRLAVPIFERVLELAPHEPQSHRDLGIALADAGQPQRAVERLYAVVTGTWDARFADIELIALAELNAAIDKARRDGRPVDTAQIDPRLVKSLPLDIRVVLAWDADNTDVDLHVFDPNGEEVSFSRNLSYQGGAITRDATGGYGPEEFALRVAKSGKYRVEATFFGHRQQVLTTGTGIMLWLSSGFGTAEQRDRRTTLQVKSVGGTRVVVGEFEVKPGAGTALGALGPISEIRPRP